MYLVKSEATILSQKDIIDQYRNAALLQRCLEEERQSGTVTMSQLISEKEVMSDVKWRPVASTILHNKSGTVALYKGDIVYKQTFYQLKKEGLFNRWIRYETCTRNKLLRLEWQACDGLILKLVSEVVSCTKQHQPK